jgi:hypothetical protein
MGIAKQQLVVALAAAVLTACGGGGGDAGGGPPPPPPPPPPAPTSINAALAWRNFLVTTQSWTVTGVGSDGQTYTLGLVLTPGPNQMFPVNGLTYATSESELSLRIGNLGVLTATSVSYFDSTSYILAGTRNIENADPATCSVATASTVPPGSAAIGTSGALQTFNDLNGCLTNSPSAGSSTTTWSVESENNVTFFCQNTRFRNTSGAETASGSTCVQSAADGTLGAKARISMTQPGFTLTARN